MALIRIASVARTVRIPLLSDPACVGVIEAEADLFRETLDPGVLKSIRLDDVTHATIRALTPLQLAEARMRGIQGAKDPRTHGLHATLAVVEAGLVSIDGFKDFEDLRAHCGDLFNVTMELGARIDTVSTLGESGASPCAPLSGEAT